MRSFIYAYAVVLSVALMIVFSTGTTVAAITEGVPNSVAGWDGGLSSYYATFSL